MSFLDAHEWFQQVTQNAAKVNGKGMREEAYTHSFCGPSDYMQAIIG